MELPLLAETGQLQQEADGVVGLVQAGQTLHRPHGVQTLSRKEEESSEKMHLKSMCIIYYIVCLTLLRKFNAVSKQ